MAVQIHVDDLLEMATDRHVLLDVRSPAEFAQGHIPGAVNIPLFTDKERAAVGTSYKQEGPQRAMQLGLEIVGPKMPEIVSHARTVSAGNPIILHCWRGGKRSASVGWLLEFAGMSVSVLSGGYKSYRTYLKSWLEEAPLSLLILGGKTGSGKTELLQALSARGEQVLDLENLANHKGSAFGWIGEEPQPSTEQFENNIFEALRKTDLSGHIWIENESRSIGRVFIPEALWAKMKSAPLIHLEIPLALRVQKLVDLYASGDANEDLSISFMKIAKRLGGQHVKAALEALRQGDYHRATEIALIYYDKTYYYGLEQSKAPLIEKLYTEEWHVNDITERLIRTAQKIRTLEVISGNGI